jgi:flagellar hook protein FlgE
MSINSAMLAGVSGLVANASALAAISDNIANVNTVAYKRNQTNFSSVVTAQAVPGHYSAGGTQAITRQLVSTQGLIQTANSATDIAINGDGFFVVTNKGLGLTNSDQRLFTRSGAFTVDANGYLVNDANLYLQGWPVVNGVANPDPSDLTSMKPINVKSLGTAVAPTTLVQLNASLFKNQAVSAGEATYNSASASMAQYADDVANNVSPSAGTKPDFTMEMSITDSSGGTHKVALAVMKSSDPTNPNNVWHAEIYAIPATDVTGGAAPGQIAAGDIAFTPNGDFDPTKSSSFFFGAAGSAAPAFTLAASSAGAGVQWASGLGLAQQTITLDISKVAQVVEPSQLKSVNSDGAGVGNVIAVQVDQDGFVSAIFDNKQVRKIAQIGLATFPNPDGLKPSSGNTYSSAIPAGVMVAKAPGTAGSGVISPSSLEASTVDLSQEFTGLITTQKAYSASSKIITTADQMLDELIQMKR